MEEQLYLKGWKGKGDLEILEQVSSYRIIEQRKNKETGEIYSDEHVIPRLNVDKLYNIIKTSCERGVNYGYRFLVRKLIAELKLDVDIEAFNGGRNRSRYYFPLLYYPLKVLEAKNVIVYYGRGGVMLN